MLINSASNNYKYLLCATKCLIRVINIAAFILFNLNPFMPECFNESGYDKTLTTCIYNAYIKDSITEKNS